MRIAIDLDGVVYEWSKTARYMLRTYRGYDANGPMGRESTHWDYIKENVEPQDWDWLWTEAIDLGLFRYGHLVQGAVVGIRDLAKQGHRLVVATARPTRAVPDTLAWLALMDLPFQGIHILSEGESKNVIKADLLIDDNIENCAAWCHHGRIALLFTREWNEGYVYTPSYDLIRAKDWPHAVQTIDRLQHEQGVHLYPDGVHLLV